MSDALTLILTALTLTAVVGEVIRVDTNVYDVPSRATRYIVQPRMDWDEAYQSCKNQSSHLVVINSQQEADDLVDIVRTETVYVGIHHKFIEGYYVAITGEDLNSTGYARWASPAPNGGLNRCISFSGYLPTMPEYQGLWDIDCNYGLRSICEQRLWFDYDLIAPHGHYKYHDTAVTWQRAWQTCRQERAHLLIINSRDEISAILNHFGEFGTGGYVWTGIHNHFYTGEFVTVFNDRLASTGWDLWWGLLIDPGRSFVSEYNDRGLFTELDGSVYSFICEHEMARN